MTSAFASPYQQWMSIPDADLSVEKIEDILGLARTSTAIERSKDAVAFAHGNSSKESSGAGNNPLVGHFRAVPADAQLCFFRSVFLQRLDKLRTFVEIEKEAPVEEIEGAGEDEVEDDWDDPWAEEPSQATSALKSKNLKPSPMPFSLSSFLTNGLLWSACQLASEEWFNSLRILLDKHGSHLWPLRLTILESIPEYAQPSAYQDITFKFDFSSNKELKPSAEPWRPEVDFSETDPVNQAVQASGMGFSTALGAMFSPAELPSHLEPLSAEELATWYKTRVNRIIDLTGMVDIALALVQHGASQGIPGLDELGEELSLLARLVYDTPRPDEMSDDWTLTRWSTLDPPAVVRAYLAHSTPGSLPKDIPQLILPYLYVLEARAERAGTPDPDLPNRLLYDFILSSPLELAASIFDASKPTLSVPQRIVKNEEDLVRLALACLYGSSSLNEWPTMSRIFECLPAWDYPQDEDNDEDAADTTIASLGAFVTPTTSRPHVSAVELMTFFKPLRIASLSRALDILDLHLEAGEIFSRWSVPAPLKWFLQSNDDAKEQRAWANRMARRAGGMHDQLNTAEDWEWLLEDMLKLTGKSDTGIKNAFGHLNEDEIQRIFLAGLLGTGKFHIARTMLYSPRSNISLDPQTVEEIVVTSSRELYDNASSGNYKIGDMKLAYDCLDVPPASERLVKEKEFIEATSRISSFNVYSRPGIPISPIEIRLTKDRLSLVSRVLSSNNDAYKHTQVILDLCHKLGFRGVAAAEVKTLAMLADTALQAEDFDRAYENAMRMVEIVKDLRETTSPLDINYDEVQEATEVCWIGCFQLGRQPEFEDLKKKLQLLGFALEFCPSEKLHDVLTAWRRLEKEDIANREEDLIQKKQFHINAMTSATLNTAASSLRAKLQQFHMPSPPLLSTPDAAALASRTFRSVAANFPFSVGQRSVTPSQASQHGGSHVSESGHHRLDDVSAQASKVFSKGIGWLIGADDE
ncbi:Neuroblastoma-amplified sequence [Leucoagaricus sp. SymC.cos]|nr:Neuroblastoma-amplified sequence [Leucoagaricus sp. SymC.cos]